jgi:hypothetical protein
MSENTSSRFADVKCYFDDKETLCLAMSNQLGSKYYGSQILLGAISM